MQLVQIISTDGHRGKKTLVAMQCQNPLFITYLHSTSNKRNAHVSPFSSFDSDHILRVGASPARWYWTRNQKSIIV